MHLQEISLATKLRITPQSRYDRMTAQRGGRHSDNQQLGMTLCRGVSTTPTAQAQLSHLGQAARNGLGRSAERFELLSRGQRCCWIGAFPSLPVLSRRQR